MVVTVTVSSANTGCNKRATASKGKILRPRIRKLEKVYTEQEFWGVDILNINSFATVGFQRFLCDSEITCTSYIYLDVQQIFCMSGMMALAA